ncbi:hypothetical protein [Aliiroseovarius sp.]|uniref:hypothetical protein n=1 Tax=Aliiroseovarius sp. TaxID=1872442 RepID=UPI00261D39E9|nr:hypothetical protein [Aliiroseovarius sp.]
MAQPKILRVYLDPIPLKQARNGEFGILTRIREALEPRGFRVEWRENSEVERLTSAARRGYALFLMDDPLHGRALTLRKAYYYPYWRIEATGQRWEFEVARKHFDPDETDPVQAQNWASNWRNWLFKQKGLEGVTRDGPVYLPLQGRLMERRSFQTMSPMEMIRTVQAATDKPILLGLHPGEDYSAAEREAVQKIADADPRVTLQTGGMIEALQCCDYVVTQNSTAALSGFFFHKPAVLFGQIDFHHQMLNVAELGRDRALSEVKSATPAFDQYLHWFIHQNSIKADVPDADQQIITALQKRGWDV